MLELLTRAAGGPTRRLHELHGVLGSIVNSDHAYHGDQTWPHDMHLHDVGTRLESCTWPDNDL